MAIDISSSGRILLLLLLCEAIHDGRRRSAVSAVALVVFAIIIGVVVSVFAYLFGWVERKVVARAQSRHGPTYVGKYGILQNLADIVNCCRRRT